MIYYPFLHTPQRISYAEHISYPSGYIIHDHRERISLKKPSTFVDGFFMSRLDTIDVIPRTQIRSPNFCKKQIFRSQVSTDTWICFTGSTFFKVYHTILRFSSNYGESSQNARFISLCCLFHSQASLSEYIDMMHERPFLF